MFDIEKGSPGDGEYREVWLRAWLAVSTANDCKKYETATRWADACLASYRERFPKVATHAA